MDAVYMLQRKIRALEERTIPEYKSLVFYSEDDLSSEGTKYLVKFVGAKGGCVTVESKFSHEGEVTLKLNGTKISAYRPVIEENLTIFIAEAVRGENLLEVDFAGAKPEKITIKLSGYIEDFPDESAITTLRQDGKTVVCHYDDRLKKVFVYVYNSGLQLVYEDANVMSASISRGVNTDEVTLFTVSSSGMLSAESLSLTSGAANAETVIEDSVRMVSGSVRENSPACYYIKDNAVKFCEIIGGSLAVSNTGIKNACKIAATPNYSGAVAVIGYDRAATLYVEPPK